MYLKSRMRLANRQLPTPALVLYRLCIGQIYKVVSSFEIFRRNCVCISDSTMHATLSHNVIIFNVISLITAPIVLIMQCPPSSCYSLFLRSKHCPQHLFSNTLNLSSSFGTRDKFSYLYETARNNSP